MDFKKINDQHVKKELSVLLNHDYGVQKSKTPDAREYEWYNEYRKSIDSNNIQKSMEILNKVMKEYPDVGLAYLFYGFIYCKKEGYRDYKKALFCYLTGAKECDHQKTLLLSQAGELAFLDIKEIKMAAVLINKALLSIGHIAWGKTWTVSYLTQERSFQFLQVICDNLGLLEISQFIRDEIKMATCLDDEYKELMNGIISRALPAEKEEAKHIIEEMFLLLKSHIRKLKAPINDIQASVDEASINEGIHVKEETTGRDDNTLAEQDIETNELTVKKKEVNTVVTGIRWWPALTAFILVNIVILGGVLPFIDELDQSSLVMYMFFLGLVAYLGAGFLMGYWIGEHPVKELAVVIIGNVYSTFKSIMRGELGTESVFFLIIGALASFAAGYFGGVLGARMNLKKQGIRLEPLICKRREKKRKKYIKIKNIYESHIIKNMLINVFKGFWKDFNWITAITGFIVIAVFGISSGIFAKAMYPRTDEKYIVFLLTCGLSIFVSGTAIGFWTGKMSIKELGFTFFLNYMIVVVLSFGNVDPAFYLLLVFLCSIACGFIIFASFIGVKLKKRLNSKVVEERKKEKL